MRDKTKSRRAAGAKVLAVALAGCGVLATCDVASASNYFPSAPFVSKVDWRSPVEVRDGMDVFQVDDLNVPITVASEDGALVIRDVDTGEVLCESPEYVYASSAPCPAFLSGEGEHHVVAEVTSRIGTRTSEPVIIEQYATPSDSDGQAPSSVSVVSTAPGQQDGATAVTLRGTPGDRLIVRDEGLWDVADEVIGESGLVTVQVWTHDRTVHLQAETQRSDQRLLTDLEVVGDPGIAAEHAPGDVDPGFTAGEDQPEPVVARPAPGDVDPGFTAPVVADDAPGDVDPGFTAPVTAQPTPGDVDPGFSIGDALQPVDPVVAFPAPGEVDPGFTAPVVAQPAPGEVDPGFTVGDSDEERPGPGEVVLVGTTVSEKWAHTDVTLAGSPGDEIRVQGARGWDIVFTGRIGDDGTVTFPVRIPAGESVTLPVTVFSGGSSDLVDVTVHSALEDGDDRRGPGELALVGTTVSEKWAHTDVTVAGYPGDDVRIQDPRDGGLLFSGRVGDDGTITFPVHIPAGETLTLPATIISDGSFGQADITVHSALEDGDDRRGPGEVALLGTALDPDGERTDVTLAGFPGDEIRVQGTRGYDLVFTGRVGDDGTVTFPVHVPAGESVKLPVTVLSEGSFGYAEITVDSALATEPVVAVEAPAEVDPDFTAGQADEPGEPEQPAEPVAAVPAPGDVDPGFTAGESEPVVAQPAPGEVDPGFTAGESEPVVAQPTPGDVDPGFTAGEDEPVVAQPTPGDVDPGFTAGDRPEHALEATVGLTSPSYGGSAVVRVVDPNATGSGYLAQVVVDGQLKGVVRVTSTPTTHPLQGLGQGAHTVDFVVDGTVVGSVTVTL